MHPGKYGKRSRKKRYGIGMIHLKLRAIDIATTSTYQPGMADRLVFDHAPPIGDQDMKNKNSSQ
ncbi:hypothetical protein [Xanthomonas fragariae]|uniref:hypothetical protein n=1 Tax=Xanthomonas fragariae TaxID=48664 RepID=UPI001ABEB7E9|nr:hypothetical protein [Xanthomonas fragariae]UKR53724.1 hypothetical protein K4A87_07650 [Xanthomonas fragariae]